MIIFLVGASVVRTTPNNPHVSAMAGNGGQRLLVARE